MAAGISWAGYKHCQLVQVIIPVLPCFSQMGGESAVLTDEAAESVGINARLGLNFFLL